MKKSTPRIVFITCFLCCTLIFSYINFCPSFSAYIHQNSVLEDAKQSFKMPEIEAAIKIVKMVVDFVVPG